MQTIRLAILTVLLGACTGDQEEALARSSEQEVTFAKRFVVVCPDRATIQQYVEVHYERGGADACSMQNTEAATRVVLLESGSYPKIRISFGNGQPMTGYVKRANIR